MISGDDTFIHCTSCGRDFYLELFDETDYQLALYCPFCGEMTLDDFDERDITSSVVNAEPQKRHLSIILGGKSKKEDQNV
jgi:predicted RNA-binding Zn-ribbon protein involved in translation (DUF1610 family)